MKSLEPIARQTKWWSASLCILTIAVLLTLERSLWCKCGGWFPIILSPASSHTSQHLFDPFTLTHFSHGLIFWIVLSKFGRSLAWTTQFVVAVGLECAWEVFENTPFVIDRYRTATAALGYEGDTIANSLMDIAACAAGFIAAKRIGLVKTVAVFAVIELFLLVTIRDSLVLNVIMLIYPIESIRQWQLGPSSPLVP